MDDLSGQTIKGYELREQVGSGGFGVVYRATQPGIGRDVAIKLIRPEFANQPDFIRRFETEAQLVARLEHPHIVPLYDYWRDASGAYLVMRWMRGNLLDALAPGPLPLDAVARLLDQIAAALAVAHRHGVVHRDLKPANILRDADANAYLADFGIAQPHSTRVVVGPAAAGESLTMAEYISPEQIKEEPVSPQTDIYSLGVLLYQILTGTPPFMGPTPGDVLDQHLYAPLPPLRERRPDLPAALEAVIERATAKAPAQRYPDALSLTMDFHRALAPATGAERAAPPLPTGTVTFLFTDIEGSTARWERDPAAMKDALARHDAILRQVTAAHDGSVYQVAGDSFVVAFTGAQAALEAAVAAQHALLAEPWPATVAPLLVRIALHTGPAERREGEYHAEYTLSRLSRLLAAGHGGQVLLTGSTRGLLGADLPPGVELRDLGEYRLRDLSHPLAVFQAGAPGLPTDFPPLRIHAGDGQEPQIATSGGPGILLPLDDERVAENPYKGLRAFQEADAADFYGREDLTARLLARLGEAGEAGRFLAVVGPSGSGKSSVVRAGLLPALRRGALAGAERWFTVEMIPGAHPFAELAAALQRVAVGWAPGLLDRLREDYTGLAEVLAAVLPMDTDLLLVVDQFEEVFTLVEDETLRSRFLTSLATAVRDPRCRLRIILTLRADFYDRPLLYPVIAELVCNGTEVVLPLAGDEVERAIVNPAARVGVTPEPDLIAAIVRDAGDQPGTLPLLQYALTEVFDHRSGRRLTLAAYRATGGVPGALAGRAEEIYAGLSAAEQEVARQLFLRLVTLGEGAEDTRRRVRLSELSALTHAESGTGKAELDRVLDAFGRHRLLTFDHDPITRGPTVEVAHEALLRTWTRLREWLDASRADLHVQRHLLAASSEWMQAGQDPSFLASGVRLAQFVALASGSQLALTGGERAYVQASVAEQERLALAERERHIRELLLQQQAASRLRALAGVLVVFLVVAVALAAIAFSQSQVAQDNFKRAEAQRLAAEANTLLQGRAVAPAPVIALLSIRSMRIEYSSQGDTALEGAAILDYPVRQFAGGNGSARSVAFAPDGSAVLVANADGTATLWNTQTGALLHRFSGHSAAVNSVAFSPDGRYVLTGSSDMTVRLWDAATGQQAHVFSGHTAAVTAVAFSPDGKQILTGAEDHTARLWDVGGGQPVRVLQHTGSPNGVAFSPDGKYLLTSGTTDKLAYLWDADTGAEIRQYAGHESGVIEVAFSPDGSQVLTGSLDGTARLWNTQTGAQVQVFSGHLNGVQGIAFAPDGRSVLTSGDDGTSRVWDVSSGKEVRKLSGHTAAVEAAAWSPDGKYLLTGSEDGTALLWNATPQTGLPQFLGHTALINAQDVAFAPDGKTVATGSSDKTVRLWDTATGMQLQVFSGHTDHVTSVAFSPDGQQVISASDDNTVRFWDVTTGAEVRRLALGADGKGHAAISPDGRYLLTAGVKNGTIWDLQTGQPVRTLVGHSDVLWGVAFSPDGKWALTASADNTARLWDVATGQPLQIFVGHTGWVTFAAASPDGKWVVTSSSDKTARLWDAHTGQLVRTFAGHTDELWDVAFSPDSRYVLTAGNDKTARLWDVATGAEIRRFVGHTAQVLAVAFAPDGKIVLTGSVDDTARLWDVDYQTTLTALCGRLVRDFTDAERVQYAIPDNAPTCP